MRIAFSVNFLILCDIIGHYATNGGLCWLQQGSEPRCSMVLMRQVSFEECCGGSSLDKAWSNSSASINEVSLLGLLGMVPCRPCKETCEGVNCGPAKVCQMKGGRPHCACSPDCTNMTRGEPVCGSDSSTYRDECALLLSRCQGQPDLEVMYRGECKKNCSKVVCPGTHTCVTDQTESAHCVMCRTALCPLPLITERSICGNNNITYASACHLRRATCFRGRSIGVRHYGPCSGIPLKRAVENAL
ncbi:follistatin-related protein 3-like [Brienomyrus brachyistius]|uniref:follistatin-related protein 3-like n=1 Tax=Brienomyrus brachyistius TaxID=42636 RepID=UPI0020B2D77C|nr:follistatin-related protein 3-like [Brienomyrus brachyistius]